MSIQPISSLASCWRPLATEASSKAQFASTNDRHHLSESDSKDDQPLAKRFPQIEVADWDISGPEDDKPLAQRRKRQRFNHEDPIEKCLTSSSGGENAVLHQNENEDHVGKLSIHNGLFSYSAQKLDNEDFYDITKYLRTLLKYVPENHRLNVLDSLFTIDEKYAKAMGGSSKKDNNKQEHPSTAQEMEKLFQAIPKPEESVAERRSWAAHGPFFLTRDKDLLPKERNSELFKPSLYLQDNMIVMPKKVLKDVKNKKGVVVETSLTTNLRLIQPHTTKVALEPCEENIRPWMPQPGQKVGVEHTEGLLFRAWDQFSKGQICDNTVGMLSMASRTDLGTRTSRQRTIRNHANWGSTSATPYISTTSSIDEIVNVRIPHFTQRQQKAKIKPNTKLTVINAKARLAAGLPVLRMNDELAYYEIQTPYGNQRNYKNSFYENEYLLPFRIGVNEIVGTWCWQDVQKWMEITGNTHYGWLREVILPAFEEHEAARK
ncbi:hypothetical protein B0J14DRAFT_520379 [Halenospora varia]|nr:hypothetical protein B0J14DRAFT_520379 [Halenospora varia]